MIVVAGPASFFVGIVSALVIGDMMLATPTPAAAIMPCVMVAVPYATNDARAARMQSPRLLERRCSAVTAQYGHDRLQVAGNLKSTQRDGQCSRIR